MLKILKMIVILVSFAMFCYQLNIATENLINPPTVDSTYERIISDNDIPLITVCPTNQFNESVSINEYYSVENFLAGLTEEGCNGTIYCYSWGAHLNLTFDSFTRYAFDQDKVNEIGILGGYYEDG